MNQRKRTKSKKSRVARKHKEHWMLTIDSREAAVNLYSILLAFQQREGSGLVDKKVANLVATWLERISEQVPDVEELAHDSRGPFRKRDLSPISASLELDAKERALMLLICKKIYSQLITPKIQRDWIDNQGQADYELAVKNYRAWIRSLEGEE